MKNFKTTDMEEEITISIKEFADINESKLPEILYKYRDWERQNDKTIITKKHIYMAQVSRFEDNKDCRSLPRFDKMTDKDIYDYFFKKSKESNIGYTSQQHRKYARDRAKNSPLKDKVYVNEAMRKILDDWDKRIGVLSLTAKPNSVEMWNKYSNLGTGFCVGFHSNILLKYVGGFGKVKYEDALPEISPFDSYEVQFAKQVFFKEKKWKFEKEFRLHKFYPNGALKQDRLIQLPKEAYCVIIFGWNMNESSKKEIIKAAKEEALEACFKQSILRDGIVYISNYPA